MSQTFFQEQSEQSMIKARIVSKYFNSWARIIIGAQKRYPRNTQKIAYIDLFAGPGIYDDKNRSTPLLVLEKIISNEDFAQRVVTIFNDKDMKNIKSLEEAVEQLEGLEKLRFKPLFYNEEVGGEIVKRFKEKEIIPTFYFIDPFGYKGISLELISSIIKDWGCECVFFFNYNRVNMGINNEIVREHMESLFGKKRFNELKAECEKIEPAEREIKIIEKLTDALRDTGTRYILPFRFKNDRGTRTSHHIIFLSKEFRGYDIMKEIMHKESSDSNDGVASFEYNSRDMHFRQGSIFDLLSRPLDELEGDLIEEYAGRTIGFNELYEKHSVDRRFIKKNYKDVFKSLLDKKVITAVSAETGKHPRAGTFSEDMIITFVR